MLPAGARAGPYGYVVDLESGKGKLQAVSMSKSSLECCSQAVTLNAVVKLSHWML